MWPCVIEVRHIRIEHALELLLMQDQQMVKAFLPHTSQESLTDSIGSRRMIGGFENLDTTCPRHPSKARPELALVISDQVFWYLPIRGGFSQLLRYPGISRGSCDSDMDHFP